MDAMTVSRNLLLHERNGLESALGELGFVSLKNLGGDTLLLDKQVKVNVAVHASLQDFFILFDPFIEFGVDKPLQYIGDVMNGLIGAPLSLTTKQTIKVSLELHLFGQNMVFVHEAQLGKIVELVLPENGKQFEAYAYISDASAIVGVSANKIPSGDWGNMW